MAGKIIGTLVGILGIAIFAVLPVFIGSDETIGRKSKEALLKFEKYDLDGNIEEKWKDK